MQEAKVKTLSEFIEKHRIKFNADWVDSRPDMFASDWDRYASHYKCRVSKGTRGFNLYFSKGSGLTGSATVDEVLNCLADDASGYDNARSFEDWASEYGYDTDSRKAEKVFRTVKRQAEQLKRTLGEDAYTELLYAVERM